MIVDNDGEVVGRRSVAAQDYEIIEFLIGEDDAPLNPILDRGFAFARRLEADRGLDPRGRFRRIAMTPVPS
jgi:hypothetical protein